MEFLESTGKTKLSLSIDNIVTSYESPYIDCSATDLCEAFAAMLVGHTFSAKTVYEGMLTVALDNMKGEDIEWALHDYGFAVSERNDDEQ